MDSQIKYTLKVQAIRPKGQTPKLYVYFPLPLAAAIGLEPGEEVQWELLDRGELHLVRKEGSIAESVGKMGKEITGLGPQSGASLGSKAAALLVLSRLR